MRLEDYIIDQAGKNWSELLAPWASLVPERFTLFVVNRFGDAFMIFEDRSIHMLDVGAYTVTKVAEDREDFADKMDQDDNANNWLMISLVDSCVAAGLEPSGAQCYGFKIPPILGGEYSVQNVALISLAQHYAFHADIYRQTKDLRHGSRVNLVIKR
jgi:hypothetical protein